MSKTGRILAFDYGTKHIGVAVGQLVTRTATPLETLSTAKPNHPQWDKINALITHWQPTELIVGHPLNMDGTSQRITKYTEAFAAHLEKRFNLPVTLVDERLTSWEAQHNSPKDSRIDLNAKAAVIILEQWLLAKQS